MAILQALGDAEEPQTLTEVALTAELARSTTFRLLAVLQDLGFVHKDSRGGTYSLGFNAYRLGQTSHAVETIVRAAQPFLRKLAYDTGLTTYLASLEGSQILVCEIVEPPEGIKSPFSESMRIDAHAVAAGKMLLAMRPEDDLVEHFATHPPRRFTTHTIASVDGLKTELRQTRQRQYAVEHGELREDIEALAVPVTSSFERPILALATIGPVPVEGSKRFQSRLARMIQANDEIYSFRVHGSEYALPSPTKTP